jgi:hypothetical protein
MLNEIRQVSKSFASKREAEVVCKYINKIRGALTYYGKSHFEHAISILDDFRMFLVEQHDTGIINSLPKIVLPPTHSYSKQQ